MRRTLFLVLGLFLPVCALAQNFTGLNLFDPTAVKNGTDLSIQYLGDIYGVVDGVLHGSGSQIMGKMFMVFNSGAILLGAIIVIYTTLLSLLNTANEGEMLGKKWNSIWIPLRTVLGIALLIPKSTGYCAIQIFMMWVIVQGVGLADTVWGQVAKYLVNGGVVIQQGMAPQDNISAGAGNMFRQVICLQGLQTAFNDANVKASRSDSNPPPIPDFTASFNPFNKNNLSCSGGTCTAELPYFSSTGEFKNWTGLNGACGVVTWKGTNWNTKDNEGLSMKHKEAKKEFEESVQIGVQQMLIDLSGPAQTYINQFVFPPSTSDGSNKKIGDFVNDQLFKNAARDYEGIVLPAQKIAIGAVQQGLTDLWMTWSQKVGWIDAGAFYQIMANQNNQAGAALFTVPKGISSSKLVSTMQNKLTSNSADYPLQSMVSSDVSKLINKVNSKKLDKFIKSAPKGVSANASKSGGAQIALTGVTGIGGVIRLIFGPLINPLINVIQGFINLTSSGGIQTIWGTVPDSATNANPVVAIAMIGYGLIGLVLEVWIAGAIALASVTGVLGAIPSLTVSTTATVLTQWLVPFFWGIAGLMFVEGAVMAFYVPLIPFILFLFGAIGWLIATLEAMVAAPIVALGITHPEGAEVLGKSDPAVLLLVNVFLRPSMMIIGFVGGIIFSYVSIWLLNVGFFQAFIFALNPVGVSSPTNIANAILDHGALTLIFGFPAMLIIYISIVIILLNYSFSLINVLPDKVMRWVGGQVEGVAGEAGRMLGEGKQAVQSSAKGLSDTAKDIAGKGGERSQKSNVGTAETGSQTGDDSGSSKKSSGDDGSGDSSQGDNGQNDSSLNVSDSKKND